MCIHYDFGENYYICKYKSKDFNIINYDKITIIDCYNNELITLPILPNCLVKLNCTNNYLINLPVLHNNLNFLHCTNNYLIHLPILPVCLKDLYCNHNKLTYLPILPNILKELDCSYNKLINLHKLKCSNKNIILKINNNSFKFIYDKKLYNIYIYNIHKDI